MSEDLMSLVTILEFIFARMRWRWLDMGVIYRIESQIGDSLLYIGESQIKQKYTNPPY